MKIRITDPGFAGFTGHLGSAYFVDGVCDDVSPSEAERMASILRFEEVDTGLNPSVTQRMVDHINKNADEMGIDSNPVLVKGTKVEDPIVPIVPNVPEAPQSGSPAALTYEYTDADLAALADSQGIAGLRSFAEPYGVTGRSIAGIVKDLLALKAEHNKPAQVEPVVETPVVVAPVVTDPVDEDEDDTETETEVDDDQALEDELADLDEEKQE